MWLGAVNGSIGAMGAMDGCHGWLGVVGGSCGGFRCGWVDRCSGLLGFVSGSSGGFDVASLTIIVGRLSPWLCGGFSEWMGLCGGFVMGRLWNSVVQLCHKHGVIRRDLKLESFLFCGCSIKWMFGCGCGFGCLLVATAICELFCDC